jgi:hypothetical protein
MRWVGFKPKIPMFERTKTVHALDRAATVIGLIKFIFPLSFRLYLYIQYCICSLTALFICVGISFSRSKRLVMEILYNYLLMEDSALKCMILKRLTIERRIWINRINERRSTFGEFCHLFCELTEHPDKFHYYFQMWETFEYILGSIAPLLDKNWAMPSPAWPVYPVERRHPASFHLNPPRHLCRSPRNLDPSLVPRDPPSRSA